VSESGRLFRKQGGAGWIVLADRLPEIGGSLRVLGERLLERIDLSRRPICVASAEADLDEVKTFVEDLEGWLGSEALLLVPEELLDLDWRKAGLVVITGGPPSVWVSVLVSRDPEAPGLVEADEGTLLYVVGEAAEAMGSWIVQSDGLRLSGIGWLRGAVVLAGRAEPASVSGVPELLSREDHSYALGLGEEAVLALGPVGEVEVWGEARPTITLGRGWR